MESKKSKVFTKKLIALFLAALLAVSTFTGVMTVFAKSTDDYHDSNLTANFLTWAETTDNQTAEALLDYADLYLPQIFEGLDLGSVKPRGTTHINFSYDIPVIGAITIEGYVDSIDGILQLVKHVNNNILNGQLLGRSYKDWISGDVKNIDLSAINDLKTSSTDGVVSQCGVAYRSQNDAKDIILAIAKLLYVHSNNYAGKNVLNQFVTGKLDLGLVGNFVNLWELLQGTFGLMNGYQSNLVYNIVANLIWQNTNWYSEEDISRFWSDFEANGANQTSWDFDSELFGKLTAELLQRINLTITYSNKVPSIELDPNKDNYGQIIQDENGDTVYVKDNTKLHWYYINKYIKDGKDYKAAVEAVNANEGKEYGFTCDPNLVYSMNGDGTSDGNVLLFVYGDKKLSVQKTDSVTEIAFNALEIAWSTAIEPTLGLLEVDYNGKSNESEIFNQNATNFDRAYFQWKSENGGWTKSDTDEDAWKQNYSEESVKAWANDVYKDYKYKSGVEASAENFLKGVAATYEYDRSRVEDPKNNWRDIDATKLFVELRYSPLADLYFKMQTGPLNLYFAQTGATNLKKFFSSAFTDYKNITEGANNGIVAAMKDFFPESEHIGIADESSKDGVKSLTRPVFKEVKTTDSQTIASTLVENAAHLFEYASNAINENVLGAFYAANPEADRMQSNSVDESNFETALLPILISCLNQLDLTQTIHNDEWDACVDTEGVAIIALSEYLSYVLPEKDYSQLWTVSEEGKLVAGTIDLDGDSKHELFDDALMPMARDALGYILQSIVPCRHKVDGRWVEWSVYSSDPATDKTTIFEILNSILCYYCSTDEFDNSLGSGASTVTGKGVAALLGCVNASGKCTVTLDKTIWQNIDTIVDTLLPVVGSLQKNTFGDCDSYDLIYTKIIQGLLEISDNGGTVTNIIKQFVDIVNSEPLNSGADVALYDYIVAPLVNGIFGGKYTNQRFPNVIPDKASYFDSDSSNNTKAESPFNALIHVDTLGGFGDGNNGILGILLSNIFEAFGGGSFNGYGDARWIGAMFAVKAVNNFIPSFVPQLSDMSFGPVTANMNITSYSGLAGNSTIGTGNYLTLTNTSLGLNRFYRADGSSATGKVQREKRYFAEIKSATITDNYGDEVDNLRLSGTTTGILAPGESLKIPVVGNTMRNTGTYGYRVAVTYNMYEAELNGGNKPNPSGEYLFNADITTYAYMTITVGGSWQSTVYPDSAASKDESGAITAYKYPGSLSNVNSANGSAGSGNNKVIGSTAGGQDNNLVASVPENIVIPSEDPSIASKFTIRVRNNSANNTRDYSGAVAYISNGTQYYSVEGSTISSSLSTMENDTTTTMAYALIDPNTGDLLNNQFYDYRIKNPGGGYSEWQRGFTRDQLNQKEQEGGDLETEFKENRVEERMHVTYTLQEALNAGIVTGVQRTNSGDGYTYQNVFVKPTAALVADNSSSAITWVTPFDGFYFANHGSSLARNSYNNDFLLAYDGNGVTGSREAYKMNLYFVTGQGGQMTVSTNVYIADQGDLYSLNTAYNSQLEKMAAYRPTDFLDYDEAAGTSKNYDNIIDSMTSALELASTPLSVENASKVSSVKINQARTADTTRNYGDEAFKPATESEIPEKVLADATKKGDIYYLNKECTIPIYGKTHLTDADVQGGKDAAGQAVVKVGSTWYLANETKYSGDWDASTYDAPYYGTVKDDSHIVKNGNDTVYEQIQFVYRDKAGNKVNSDENWVVKFAETDTVIKPNAPGEENRGVYQQGIDTINYWNSKLSSILKTVGAQSIAKDVTEVRSQDSNNVNYDVASYEKMVKVAREAESLMWYEPVLNDEGGYTYDENGNMVTAPTTDRSSMEVEIAVQLFEDYYARAVKRGYIGDKLEEEIAKHHAIGGSYENFTAVEDEDVFTVQVDPGTKLGFGTRGEDGYLANLDEDGNKAYTDASWAAYVDALGRAVKVATEQTATLSNIYTAKSQLVIAENNLEPFTGVDLNSFTVSGKITIAENREGTSGKYGVVGIKILDEEGTELGTSAEDGSFEIKLPKGKASTTLTVKGDTTVDRTITITGEEDISNVNIPIITCNFERSDDFIDKTDAGIFLTHLNSDNVYANLEASDNTVDKTDAGLFLNFMSDTPVVYDNWSQSTYVLS